MPSIFEKIDKIRPLYDAVYKFVLFICKLLLVVDIAITSMSVAGRYISFIPDPAWSEEVVLSCMAYMAVLSAALAIRRGAHIRMTALDSYLPKKLVKSLDILADVAVLVLAVIMLTVGWTYASGIGSRYLCKYAWSIPFLDVSAGSVSRCCDDHFRDRSTVQSYQKLLCKGGEVVWM